jgi:hypothetical protein
MIDAENRISLDTDTKGDLYEGLLQKNAEDTKSGAACLPVCDGRSASFRKIGGQWIGKRKLPYLQKRTLQNQ